MRIPQSIAIARFLAHRFKLDGKDDIERAKSDAIVLGTYDFLNAYFAKVHPFKEDAAKIEDAKKNFTEQDLPLHLTRFEKLAELFGTPGFSVGSSLKWSDLAIYDSLETLYFVNINSPKVFQAFPRLLTIQKTVENNERIREYLKNRPQTAF